ncbi:MAG: hypothetical protein JWN52_7978 [Actinomycetia bacterium]|nr:hypothetical protein [Actinomycetes bacterium]
MDHSVTTLDQDPGDLASSLLVWHVNGVHGGMPRYMAHQVLHDQETVRPTRSPHRPGEAWGLGEQSDRCCEPAFIALMPDPADLCAIRLCTLSGTVADLVT